MAETVYTPATLAVASAIGEHARRRGVEPAAFAIAWMLANQAVTGAIAGPRTLAQWESYLAALDVAWTAEDERRGRRAGTAGHDSGAPVRRSGLSGRGRAG